MHQTLARHPKVLRLAARLRAHKAASIGHLTLLWLWTLDYAPNGDLSAFGPAEVSAAAEWPGKSDEFYAALQETGWIDSDHKVHDWMDYAGKLVEKRQSDRERKRVHRTSIGIPTDGAGTVPNRTVPNRTQPNTNTVDRLKPVTRMRNDFDPPTFEDVQAFCIARGNSVKPQAFLAHYASNGWKVGRNPMKDWKAAIVTWENTEKRR